MVLGSHVEQAGSFVTNDRLRFDFTHFSAITDDEILKVEDIVNPANINKSSCKYPADDTIDDAKKVGSYGTFR